MEIQLYQVVAVVGSLLLFAAGALRFSYSGSPKEMIIAALYLAANILIFCL